MPDLRLAAHAKVNLRLRVLGREASGYHHLETLFARLALHDVVELTLPESAAPESGGGGGIRLEVTGPEADGVPDDAGNLCWRAAEAFFRELGSRSEREGGPRPAGRVSIRLEKHVPAGAGLGGGSADAAAVLRGLNELHGRPLAQDALHGIAGAIGSDVPFPLSGASFALGWGRGRRLLPLAPPPVRPLLVVRPELRIPTEAAYGWLVEDRAADSRESEEAGSGGVAVTPGPLPPAGELADWSQLAVLAVNDFEAPVFRRHPELARIRDDLRDAGAQVTLLAGSGSAVFAVFADAAARDRARAAIRGESARILTTRAPARERGRATSPDPRRP